MNLHKFIKISVIFFIIFAWIFSGFPQIWQDPPIPPEIQEAKAVTITFTTSDTWTAPTGVTSVSVEVRGGGGAGGGTNTTADGGGGGGGGAYSKKNSVSVTPGNNYTVTVGTGGTGVSGADGNAGNDSWFVDTSTVLAKGGGGGKTPVGGAGGVAGAGGAALSGIGDIKSSGGSGGTGSDSPFGAGGGGGGGAGDAADGGAGGVGANKAPGAGGAGGTSGGGDGGAGGYQVNGNPGTALGGAGGGSGNGTLSGGNGAAGKVVLTYNLPPNAPSQDFPLNNDTGVSVTPTFNMTATDPESDNLGYKVVIYSDSICTTIVQTNDQAATSIGWTGQDATCVNNPTSCYLSGTQGSFLTQTALSGSTQYWWKASAKDPDGNGTFTNSTTCNTFTTQAAYTVSCSASAGATSFGTLTTSAISTSTPDIVITMSCDYPSGCTLRVQDDGNAADPGLYSATATYLIGSANTSYDDTDTLVQGTEGYGIQATTNANGSGGTLTIAARYDQTGDTVGGLEISNQVITSSTEPITNRETVIKHKTAISNLTPAASDYEDTITYSCSGN